jgi:ATP-dependent RNA helicase DDX10/DBP4
MRSVHIQKDKTIFKLSELPAEKYAASMGLPGAPQIKLLENAKSNAKSKVREGQKKVEEMVVPEMDLVASSDESEDEDVDDEEDDDALNAGKDVSESEASGDASDSDESDEDKVSIVLQDEMHANRYSQSPLLPCGPSTTECSRGRTSLSLRHTTRL